MINPVLPPGVERRVTTKNAGIKGLKVRRGLDWSHGDDEVSYGTN
jgi:hypothetical protein